LTAVLFDLLPFPLGFGLARVDLSLLVGLCILSALERIADQRAST